MMMEDSAIFFETSAIKTVEAARDAFAAIAQWCPDEHTKAYGKEQAANLDRALTALKAYAEMIKERRSVTA